MSIANFQQNNRICILIRMIKKFILLLLMQINSEYFKESENISYLASVLKLVWCLF